MVHVGCHIVSDTKTPTAGGGCSGRFDLVHCHSLGGEEAFVDLNSRPMGGGEGLEIFIRY